MAPSKSGSSNATPRADATVDIAGASGVAAPAGSESLTTAGPQKTDEDKAKGGEQARATTMTAFKPKVSAAERNLIAPEENPEADKYIRDGVKRANERSNGPK